MFRMTIVMGVIAGVGLCPTQCSATIKIAGVTVDVTNNAHYLAYARYMRVPRGSQRQTQAWLDGTDANAIRQLETEPILKTIYDKMAGATEVFQFATSQDAENESYLRWVAGWEIKRMDEMRHFWYGSSRTTCQLWKFHPAIKSGPSHRGNFYMFQKIRQSGQRTLSSDAIDEITNISQTTRAECYTATVVCLWLGQYVGLGASGFDALYPNNNDNNVSTRLDTWEVGRGETPSRSKLIRSPQDATIVPGDWQYAENYDYRTVINYRPFYTMRSRVPEDHKRTYLLKNADNYLWSGENLLCTGYNPAGQPLYSGLSREIIDLTKDQVNAVLVGKYYDDLGVIINNDGRYNGVRVTAIDAGKITWMGHRRPHN